MNMMSVFGTSTIPKSLKKSTTLLMRSGVMMKSAPTRRRQNPMEMAVNIPSWYLGWMSLFSVKQFPSVLLSCRFAYNISPLLRGVHVLNTQRWDNKRLDLY